MAAVSVAPMAILATERSPRLMDGGADCRPDLLPHRLGLGLGAVRGRGALVVKAYIKFNTAVNERAALFP